MSRQPGPAVAAMLALSLAACAPAEQEVAAVPAATTPAPVAPEAAAVDVDAADAPPPPEAADAAPPAVAETRLDHAGPVLVGQRYADLAAQGQWQAAGLLEILEGGGCEYYSGGLLPEGVSMMVQDDVVVRFDLDVATEEDGAIRQPVGPFGLTAGISREQALERLPAGAVFSPHAYVPETGHYLTWQDPGSDLAIRVELDDGVVTSVYWGASDSVELIEGCA
ncbi:hypothetical protein OK348_00200 [Flavobacterium sp. MXW15]|uniref:Lectin n=1 Tax=Xanthomonas chitinilytica TaxID=2989819 RepID=A0ABT3JR84_9XANT|nr:hypothetical protein [Xanthomonas sp. H13-6]MCW4453224.1 hypothetical protein [Flavobacterium sp. MXW15]MCW4470938.1 hypothetical protein [Xanthomonas sp. H13-6]